MTVVRPDHLKEHDQRAGYFPWFDLLRAACALTVLWSHSGLFAWEQAGNFAVQVFFALSGWLIGGILLDLTPSDLPRFYFNRAIRIWIPYYLAVALLLAVSIAREPITHKWIEFVIYKLTFVWNLFGTQQLANFQNAMPQKGTLNHVWSVNAEEQFYLVSPLFLVLAAVRGGRSAIAWVGLALLAVVFAPQYLAITLGVLAAIVVRRFGPVHATRRARVIEWAVLLVSAYGLTTNLSYFLVAPFTAISIVLLFAVEGRKTALGTVLGGMSYPLYLNQWIGGYASAFLLKGGHHGFWIGLATTTAISVGVAVGLYWFVDRRLLALRGGWFTQRRGHVLTTCAYAMIAIGVAYGLTLRMGSSP